MIATANAFVYLLVAGLLRSLFGWFKSGDSNIAPHV